MDVAYEFAPLVATKLIIYTFGALVHLFLMVLILGNRRLRRLEWLLFALMAALFTWNSGNLLALNVGLFYGVGPDILAGFSRLIAFLGLATAAPLLVHVQAEYLELFHPARWWRRLLVVALYVPLVAVPWLVGRNLLEHIELDPVISLGPFRRAVVVWVIAALAAGTTINVSLLLDRRISAQRLVGFHGWLGALQGLLAMGFVWVYLLHRQPVHGLGGYFPTLLMLLAILPSVLLGYWIFRYNFLDLRLQRNVIYSLAAIFGFLIYLNLMRRLGGLLEAHEILPAAVTEGVMIFILVVLFQPVKQLINRSLHKAFVSEFERVQRLSAEIQEFAKRCGDVQDLKRFVEERTREELGLAKVVLRPGCEAPQAVALPAAVGKERTFLIQRGKEVIGALDVIPPGAELSGDQYGALEVLADQLAAALELCQLIAEKLKLERELSEKAKMAFLGEMAARIAHNVKNPLSSMKTLVQLLEEDVSLPERVRQDCRMVVAEIDRLNHNISQVLRYAKPARDTDRPVDLAAVVNRVLELTRAEAERRQVKLQAESQVPCPVEGGEEAASDIVSNLVVNALEASGPGEMVRISVRCDSDVPGRAELRVEDQGRGIPPELKEKIFQPFFTTRPGGTGLGLAIVSRRLEEIGGSVECTSPLEPESRSEGRRGARFLVRFRTVLSSPVAL